MLVRTHPNIWCRDPSRYLLSTDLFVSSSPSIWFMVQTREQHRHLFQAEALRLSLIDMSSSEQSEPSPSSSARRPPVSSNMEEQFMSTLAKEQVKTLTKFGGGESEDVALWLDRVEEIFDRAFLQPSNRYLAVQSYLTDAALKWFRFNQARLSTWPSFKNALLRTYQPSIHQALIKLEQRHQLPGEKVMEYYYDKLRLCNQADPRMSPSMIVHYLSKGLHASLLPHVLRRHPATSADFLTVAEDEEKILATLNGLTLSSPYPSDPYSDDVFPLASTVASVHRSTTPNARPIPAHHQRPPMQPLMDVPTSPPPPPSLLFIMIFRQPFLGHRAPVSATHAMVSVISLGTVLLQKTPKGVS